MEFHIICYGRKTFDSLPNGALKGRQNIVISRDLNLKLDSCEIIYSIDELSNIVDINEEIFIIGGSEIYSLFFPFANKIYITRIYKDFDYADTYFKEFNSESYSNFNIDFYNENINNEFKCQFATTIIIFTLIGNFNYLFINKITINYGIITTTGRYVI